MDKAEEKAMQYCCTKCANNKRNCGMKLISHGNNCIACSNYIAGYQQAEKDLELTNADIYDIWRIYNEVCAEGEIYGFDETSQEVLKRFKKEKHINEQKEEKVWQTK